jgi:hypothetical protein
MSERVAIPETVVLNQDLLDQLHLTLKACRRLAMQGKFPPIRRIDRGVYVVRPDDLRDYCENGTWITKAHPRSAAIDVAGNLRRAEERKVAARKGRQPRQRSSSDGGQRV